MFKTITFVLLTEIEIIVDKITFVKKQPPKIKKNFFLLDSAGGDRGEKGDGSKKYQHNTRNVFMHSDGS